jgi:hypothetical protein
MSGLRKEEVREVLEEFMDREGREIIRQEVYEESLDREVVVEEVADEVEQIVIDETVDKDEIVQEVADEVESRLR